MEHRSDWTRSRCSRLPEALIPGHDAARCRDVFLVWTGEASTGLTAGWLGLPCEGDRPWLAVQRLWWDESDARVTALPGTVDAVLVDLER